MKKFFIGFVSSCLAGGFFLWFIPENVHIITKMLMIVVLSTIIGTIALMVVEGISHIEIRFIEIKFRI